jgi:hypothetical protein
MAVFGAKRGVGRGDWGARPPLSSSLNLLIFLYFIDERAYN